MPELSPAGRAALGYWGVIEKAAQLHMPTADLWQAIRDAAEELGLASPGVTVQGVNEIRSIATGVQRRADAFDRARDSERMHSGLAAEVPWSRDVREQNALQITHVRFQHTFLRGGAEESEWRTSVVTGALPDTVGELRALIGEDAEQLAAKYGTEHVGVSGVQVLAV